MIRQHCRYLLLITTIFTAAALTDAGCTRHTQRYQTQDNDRSPTQTVETFIQLLLPDITRANHNLLVTRYRIINLQRRLQRTGMLSARDHQWLATLARQYGLQNWDTRDGAAWRNLLSRVDIIPPSLALAQAANESNWGKSRFAREANNFFGQHCNTPDCGIVPHNRAADASFEVTYFTNRADSVAGYMHMLNTGKYFAHLRILRQQQRKQGEIISGYVLAEGLSQYSALQEKYVAIIRQIIEHYNLSQYDRKP